MLLSFQSENNLRIPRRGPDQTIPISVLSAQSFRITRQYMQNRFRLRTTVTPMVLSCPRLLLSLCAGVAYASMIVCWHRLFSQSSVVVTWCHSCCNLLFVLTWLRAGAINTSVIVNAYLDVCWCLLCFNDDFISAFLVVSWWFLGCQMASFALCCMLTSLILTCKLL